MVHLVWGLDEAVCEYVKKAFPHMTHPWVDCEGIGIADGNKLVGGIVVEMLTTFDASVTLLMDTPRSCNKSILRDWNKHMFDTLKLSRVTLEVHPKNKKSRRFVEGLGAKLEGKKRKGYDGHRPVLIYGLLPEEARFYEIPQTA